MTAGSGSSHSGSSSNTAQVFPTQQDGAGAAQNPVAAQQDNVGPMDRPLPIRRRQRKPDRKSKTVVQAEALSPPPAPAHKRKRGRKPKTKGRTSDAHSLLLLALLPVLADYAGPSACVCPHFSLKAGACRLCVVHCCTLLPRMPAPLSPYRCCCCCCGCCCGSTMQHSSSTSDL